METKEKVPTLFEVMRVLSAEQRQNFGALRRKWNAKSGVREELEKSETGWSVNYYKGEEKVAEAKLAPQKLEFQEF